MRENLNSNGIFAKVYSLEIYRLYERYTQLYRPHPYIGKYKHNIIMTVSHLQMRFFYRIRGI